MKSVVWGFTKYIHEIEMIVTLSRVDGWTEDGQWVSDYIRPARRSTSMPNKL